MFEQITNKITNLKTKMLLAASSLYASLFLVKSVNADSGVTINIKNITNTLNTQGNSLNGLDNAGDKIVDVINTITGWLMALSVGVALIFGIISAWSIMSAGGNPSKKENAKQSLINVLIGCAVIGGLSLIVKIALGLFAGA